MPLQHSNTEEISQFVRRKRTVNVTIVRATEENVMQFSLYETFVRICNNNTNHSGEPPLLITLVNGHKVKE